MQAATLTRRLITTEKTAEKCAVCQRTISNWVEEMKIPKPVRLGRAVRFDEAKIDAWIEANCPSCESDYE